MSLDQPLSVPRSGQVIITAINQYGPEQWKNPTSVWCHGDGLKASENQQSSQLRQPEHLPNLHTVRNGISATKKTIIHPSAS